MINGEFTEQVSVHDRGLHYGDGVFETLVASEGVPEHWQEHMERLASGCQRLKIAMPDEFLLESEVKQVIQQQLQQQLQDQANSVPRFIIKIIVTRGIGQRGYRPPLSTKVTRIISLHHFPEYPAHYYMQGVEITQCKIPLSCNPVLAGIKHLNRLEQVMAQSEWDDPDIIDGIMLNSDHHIVECTMSNLFWVTDNQLITPDLSNCGVEGVTRANILRLAEELQISITIGNFMMKDLLAADEIFISNSVFGIFPVKKIGGCVKQPGPVTRKIMSAFD